jgi:hypothetical protein
MYLSLIQYVESMDAARPAPGFGGPRAPAPSGLPPPLADVLWQRCFAELALVTEATSAILCIIASAPLVLSAHGKPDRRG